MSSFIGLSTAEGGFLARRGPLFILGGGLIFHLVLTLFLLRALTDKALAEIRTEIEAVQARNEPLDANDLRRTPRPEDEEALKALEDHFKALTRRSNQLHRHPHRSLRAKALAGDSITDEERENLWQLLQDSPIQQELVDLATAHDLSAFGTRSARNNWSLARVVNEAQSNLRLRARIESLAGFSLQAHPPLVQAFLMNEALVGLNQQDSLLENYDELLRSIEVFLDDTPVAQHAELDWSPIHELLELNYPLRRLRELILWQRTLVLEDSFYTGDDGRVTPMPLGRFDDDVDEWSPFKEWDRAETLRAYAALLAAIESEEGALAVLKELARITDELKADQHWYSRGTRHLGHRSGQWVGWTKSAIQRLEVLRPRLGLGSGDRAGN